MYYINEHPNESGNHGNPVSNQTTGMVALPDSLLNAYIAAKGFVNIQTDGGMVTVVETNQEALAAYEAEYPEAPEDVEKPLSTNLLKNQIQVLTDQQSFLEDCIAEMAQIVYE